MIYKTFEKEYLNLQLRFIYIFDHMISMKNQLKAKIQEKDFSYDAPFKLVKNATAHKSEGIFYIVHYGKVIFAYDPSSERVEVDWHCSRTSDKQIRYALAYFDPKNDPIDVHEGSKWNYSESVN